MLDICIEIISIKKIPPAQEIYISDKRSDSNATKSHSQIHNNRRQYKIFRNQFTSICNLTLKTTKCASNFLQYLHILKLHNDSSVPQ